MRGNNSLRGSFRPATISRPGYASEEHVTAIAKTLLGPESKHFSEILSVLEPLGATPTGVRLALRLAGSGTVARPNARLKEYGESLDFAVPGVVRAVRDNEVYPRAAYIAKAALRLSQQATPAALRAALRREKGYQQAHERARRGRLDSAAQVQAAARTYGWRGVSSQGTLVGWYLNPLLNNDAECIAANGNNFYAEKGTIIGLPGSVHPNCGCYAGPPHSGARLVDDVVGGLAHGHGRTA